jgi:DNA (cytosine-5)-methyltransferase 1
MGYEQQFTKLIPTPRASDYKGSAANRWYSQNGQVEREREREAERVPQPAMRIAGSHSAWDNWPVEPGISRVVDGVPNRVDRIKCLGNAVVPQQFYPFFAAIAEIESAEHETSYI